MSLTTRCPACGTMFKVVPDQLRISEGWVRCGQCGNVFDASSSLHNDQFDEPLPDVDGRVDTPAPASPATDSTADSTAHPPQGTQPPAWDESLERQEPPTPSRPLGLAPEYLDDAIPADLSFVQQAERQAVWRRPLMRAILALLFVVLSLGLVVQIAVQDRDRLAATHPPLKPWLEKICRPLGCKPGPLRQIESIVIDSSTFNKLRPDTYRLSFVLKNQATIPVALPALELTLTDSQDQPVLRRVLTPEELRANTDTIAPVADWSSNLVLSVASGGNPARIAGYRLLAFYP